MSPFPLPFPLREYWKARGFTNAEVDKFVEVLDKDVHRAISESGWWDEELMKEITEQEKALGRILTKVEVLNAAKKVLEKVGKFNPRNTK